MALPVTIPNAFANATSSIPLSQLDANFNALSNAINGINSGAETLANLTASNVTITGGTISNVTLDNVTVTTESFDNITLSNVTIVSGNATVTDLVASNVVITGGTFTGITAANIAGANISSGNAVLSNLSASNVTITGGTMSNVSNVAYLDVDQTFSGSNRGAVTVDNDGSFDMNAGNNFQCTPNAAVTLEFTNITPGQSGFVLLDNTGAYTVSANSAVKVSTTALSTMSANGVYLMSYFSPSNSAVYVVNSGALA
jgi:hypothetical protein